ncbi:MAG: DUF4249 domain-containing protein [Sediminibacterium sp. Gen4]|jgi:hypothetical protein|uniref:DUF4249 domain-containing protein n=1 Tax=unclassified Sediminibacterium TaxID=2635961 RepID=UPI0015B8092F|nr:MULTISPECIES: DUF4249 domain-containing protein [unclassified Sediminibacterium]MBW0159971.1 DUF4249 domain-containing protein [Sediminibacterium sp.]MBW0163246.1 DUF4249 domain-containing protein [Sediminibacterium sp.]NWK67350.1 DUF4249 domain-containing protein [Sediminibacterium sp. Gen4]
MFRNLIFVWVCILLIACEREINITPVNKDSRLVVDAEIENGRAPIVVLSKSLNFFSTIDSAELANSYIRNATVSIQEGNTIYPLKEFEIRDTSGNRFYYYSTDPQAIPQLIGQFGKNYKLSINVEGISYTSETTIPLLTKTMDSIWWKPAPNNDDPKKVVLMARVQDPPGLGNYIRYFTRQNSQAFLPGLNSVFDDNIIDGKTYEIQVDRGVNRNEDVDFETYGFFQKGDTVSVKLCNISKSTYDFWRTWEFNLQSVGNPFSSPGKVIGNISNNALGAFCGYAAQYRTLIIPK